MRALESGDDADAEASDERQDGRYRHDLVARGNERQHRHVCRMCQTEEPESAPSDEDRERSAGRRQQNAFRDELSKEPSSSSAERVADGELPFARRAAGEQEMRDVGAGNEEEQSDRADDSHQRIANAQVVLRACESPAPLNSFRQRIARCLRVDRGNLGLGRFSIDAGSQADGDSASTANTNQGVGRDRHPDLGMATLEIRQRN